MHFPRASLCREGTSSVPSWLRKAYTIAILLGCSLVWPLNESGARATQLSLRSLSDFIGAGENINSHQFSHVVKRCASLMLVAYQLSSEQDEAFRHNLNDAHFHFIFLSARNDIANFNIDEDIIEEYTERSIAPYAAFYNDQVNQSYLENGNYFEGELIDSDLNYCGRLRNMSQE